MTFLLGRYERTASEFYADYSANNKFFKNEPIKKMSKLTKNLLHAIDYRDVEQKRKENFEYLNKKLGNKNLLTLKPAEFMYPFMIKNGAELKKRLQAEKIYIPTLWPTVFELTGKEDMEYKMAENILPLPIDQRYTIDDMEYMCSKILELMEE
jgi:dTDP-4-amino-4,6-dideoxygalactose transaminase